MDVLTINDSYLIFDIEPCAINPSVVEDTAVNMINCYCQHHKSAFGDKNIMVQVRD